MFSQEGVHKAAAALNFIGQLKQMYNKVECVYVGNILSILKNDQVINVAMSLLSFVVCTCAHVCPWFACSKSYMWT